jgi:hypothetical protein
LCDSHYEKYYLNRQYLFFTHLKSHFIFCFFYVGGSIKNLALSNTGQYQILSSDLLGGIPNIYVSSDSGNSWGSSKREGIFLQSSILAISSNGQYQIQAFTNNNTVDFSSDFGKI